MEVEKREYDLFVGTSTGSLLIPHLALDNIDLLYDIYTTMDQRKIFSLNPFVVRKKENREYVSINFMTTFLQFIKRKRTFGESKSLRKTIRRNFLLKDFEAIRASHKDVVVTVSNLSKNKVEYKSIKDFDYDEFCDWIWISCNYIPFMSLVKKGGYEYGDGGLGCVLPIREAVKRGATVIDAIILESENMEHNKVLGKNPFSLMLSIYGFALDQIEKHDISEGILSAKHRGVQLNLYYTPTKLTENSLVFDKKLMTKWWLQGFNYAEMKADGTH
ncbi:MAG: patatin [Maribacter sp.]|nr:MAG: patatin [Maribacter sp.]